MEPEGSLPFTQKPAPCPYPAPYKPVHAHPSHSFKIHCHIILCSTPRSSTWSLSFRSSHQDSECTSLIPQMCHRLRPSNLLAWIHITSLITCIMEAAVCIIQNLLTYLPPLFNNNNGNNSNEKLKEKVGSCTRKTFDRFTTKDSYTWNITHNTESTAVWSLKPVRWGSLLVQENYQEE